MGQNKYGVFDSAAADVLQNALSLVVQALASEGAHAPDRQNELAASLVHLARESRFSTAEELARAMLDLHRASSGAG